MPDLSPDKPLPCTRCAASIPVDAGYCPGCNLERQYVEKTYRMGLMGIGVAVPAAPKRDELREFLDSQRHFSFWLGRVTHLTLTAILTILGLAFLNGARENTMNEFIGWFFIGAAGAYETWYWVGYFATRPAWRRTKDAPRKG